MFHVEHSQTFSTARLFLRQEPRLLIELATCSCDWTFLQERFALGKFCTVRD